MNSVSAGPIAMFLIIFLWTPPHFWALALCRSGDYERVGVPMLPNVVGPVKTCRQIVAYSLLLVPASLGPMLIPGVGLLYGAVAVAANAGFLWRAFALYRLRDGEELARRKAAMALFGFSILYLFVLFAAMLAEVHAAGTRLNPGGSHRACRRSAKPDLERPNEVNMPDLDPNVKRRNWIVLIVLVAVAAGDCMSPSWSR